MQIDSNGQQTVCCIGLNEPREKIMLSVAKVKLTTINPLNITKQLRLKEEGRQTWKHLLLTLKEEIRLGDPRKTAALAGKRQAPIRIVSGWHSYLVST